MQQLQAEVLSITALTSFVHKVTLKTAEEIAFKAGQYLNVVMGDADKRPFSIASTPNQTNLIELHIGASKDNPYAYEVLTKAREDKQLQIELGIGNAYIRESQKHAILIAGGTGFSYTRSILLHMLETQPQRQVTLYWGAKREDDLYAHDALVALSEKSTNFTYIPVVEDNENWKGRDGLVHLAVLQDITDFRAIEVYTAGRFEMAAIIRDEFIDRGLPSEHLFGDAYAFI